MSGVWAVLTSAGTESGPGGDVYALTRVCRAARQAGQDVPVLDLTVDEQVRVFRWTGRPGEFMPWSGPLERPQAVYNRVPGRARERRVLWSHRALLGDVLVANPHFLDKDQFALRVSPDAGRGAWRVPNTRVAADCEDVYELLCMERAVYLKPVSGHAGAGIIRCERRATGLQIQTQSPAGGRCARSLPSAQARLWLRSRTRSRRYVAQAEAPTLRWRGRRFDLRVLVQRRPGGAWDVTGAGARVGAPGAIVTHVPNGGSIAPAQAVLAEVFSGRGRQVWEHACASAVEVAACASQGAPDWCEFTVDMGFGTGGEVYVFEANAKPMRFDEVALERLAKARVVEYLTWLSEKQQAEAVVPRECP
ncbi:MAG: YheC/YheD family protein [Firmicutes bacterium]|nr:YheC/YheD family protein [Bacillota bacterium]